MPSLALMRLYFFVPQGWLPPPVRHTTRAFQLWTRHFCWCASQQLPARCSAAALFTAEIEVKTEGFGMAL